MVLKVSSSTLEETLCKTELGRTNYEDTVEMVAVALYSVFPERRAYALNQLDEYWQQKVSLHTETKQGELHAYLVFNNLNYCFLVETFAPDLQIEEGVPTPVEMASWKSPSYLSSTLI